jgi:hypothetical protein
MSAHRTAPLLLVLLSLSLPCPAATFFVSKSGDGTDGSSWQTAHTALSDAIHSSATNDLIWVAAGVYIENVTIEFPLTILGGFNGDETPDQIHLRNPDANLTIFDGNRLGTVVVVESDTLIDGVTIRNGKAANGSGLRGINCNLDLRSVRILSNGERTKTGGGVYISNASMTLYECKIISNLADDFGGGIYAENSFLKVLQTEFTNNISGLTGSGIVMKGGRLEIVQCVFKRNGREGESGSGGGVALIESNLEVVSSLFSNNYGGGIFIHDTKTDIQLTTFTGNNGGIRGGGISSYDSEYSIDRCVFRENVANALIPPLGVSEAGAIYSQDSTGKVSNSLFIQNQSHAGNSVRSFMTDVGALGFENCTFDMTPYDDIYSLTEVSWADNPPFFLNCIFTGREKSIFMNLNGDVRYSNIQGGYPGVGNIEGDPKFVDPANGDYHLQRGSPCIDSGTDTGLDHDFDGNFRPIGDYDMGAFEFPFLRSDIDKSGKVDSTDLLILQEDWKKVSGI